MNENELMAIDKRKLIETDHKKTPELSIGEISRGDTNINLICKIVTLNSKGYTKNGAKLTRYYGLLEDSTGTISFTAWRDLEVSRNDIVQINQASIREWQGVSRVNIGTNTKVRRIYDKNIINKFESLSNSVITKKIPINSLKPDQNEISCLCRVVSIEPLEIKQNNSVRTIYKGVLADNSGSIRFTAWHDFELQPNMILTIQYASVKIFRGFLELILNGNTMVINNPDVSFPELSELPIDYKLTISDLYERDYFTSPEFFIEGTLLDFKGDSGIIYRCSKCTRTVKGGECAVHGPVEVNEDLRLKAILDDGTGAVTLYIGKQLTERLLGKSLGECKEMLLKYEDKSVAKDIMLSHLKLQDVKVKGNVIKDDYGTSLIASSISIIEISITDIQKDAQALLESID